MASDAITIRTRLAGAKAAAAEARAVGKGVGGIGTAAGKAEAKSRRFGRTHVGVNKTLGKVRGSAFGAAKGVLALGAAYVGAAGIKSSISTTEELARSTISLHKNLGLSVEKASEWAAVARSRDIDTKALNMSFGTLSKNIEGASKAGSTQAQIFDKLGVSQKTVASGDFNAVLGETADRLKAMGPGAERTALTMKLFGRGWQTVVPLLRDGSGEMNSQLALARKYGATFHGHTIKSLTEFIQAQRESKIATMGLQIAVGTKLIPIITKGLGAFSRFVGQMKSGKGAGGEFADTAKRIWQNVKPVVLWAGRAAVNIAKFGAHHRNVAKVAAAVFLARTAFRKLGGGVIFSVVRQLGRLTIKAVPIVAKFGAWLIGRFGVIGTQAGRRVSAKAAMTAGKTTGAWGIAGSLVGRVFIAEIFYEMSREFGPKLAHWMKNNLPEGPNLGMGLPSPPGSPQSKTNPTGLTPKGDGKFHPAPNLPQPHLGPGQTRPRGNPNSGGKRALLAPQFSWAGAGAMGGDTVVHTTLELDGKEVARSVARHVRNDRARR